MSSSMQPLPQCRAPLATITGNGVCALLGMGSSRVIAARDTLSRARRPYVAYCHTTHRVPNSAVTGQTTFMMAMGWG